MSQWAADELVGLDLGDHRLNERLVKMVEAFSARPEASVPQASGNWAATKGAYRFWDSDQVSAAAILAPHLQASIGRAGGQPRVLVVQDTTDLDFTAHPSTQGIGPLDNQWVKGLKVHSALLVSLAGVPLGLVHQAVWVREGRVGVHRRKRETAEKESQRWLTALQASQAACRRRWPSLRWPTAKPISSICLPAPGGRAATCSSGRLTIGGSVKRSSMSRTPFRPRRSRAHSPFRCRGMTRSRPARPS